MSISRVMAEGIATHRVLKPDDFGHQRKAAPATTAVWREGVDHFEPLTWLDFKFIASLGLIIAAAI
jgi:hypothetical protein